MPRRRPLIYEEIADRQRRQVSTGRGQAAARPVRLYPTKPVRSVTPRGPTITGRMSIKRFSGTINDTEPVDFPSVESSEGDAEDWFSLTTLGSVDDSQIELSASGLYVVHAYLADTGEGTIIQTEGRTITSGISATMYDQTPFTSRRAVFQLTFPVLIGSTAYPTIATFFMTYRGTTGSSLAAALDIYRYA